MHLNEKIEWISDKVPQSVFNVSILNNRSEHIKLVLTYFSYVMPHVSPSQY